MALRGPCGRTAARAYLLFLAVLSACGTRGPRDAEIQLGPDGFLSPVLTAEQVAAFSERLERGGVEDLFQVFVAGRRGSPLFGEYRMKGGRILFTPSYPLQPGMTYTAYFSRTGWGAGGSGAESGVEQSFTIPAPPGGPPARVVRVTPTRSVLPENQLKFYVYFSAPMSRGEVYSRVRLRADGKEVEHPFLELGEELWDESGTRITLFFDPGRIKRELKPREEVGPSLEEGKSYELVIDRGWPDAQGRPLEAEFRKTFRAAAPDVQQPDPARWSLAPPRPGSRDPFVVLFDEPLDHAMLGRVLEVLDPSGAPVAGRIEIDAEETRWSFMPERPWAAGRHSLRVDTLLEDLAGNSIAKPFEVDVFRPIERKIVPQRVALPFEVR